MKYATPNEWDDRALTLMGVSVKQTETPIGLFGTGLKYAVAYILRNGYSLTLTVDGETRQFGSKTIEFRGEPQKMCTLDGEPLPFAINYGHHWEDWMACREFVANTIDEGGTYGSHAKGRVVFETNMPFVDPMIPKHLMLLYEDSEIQIFEGPSNHLYYKGFRVADLPRQSAHTINKLTDVQLTEDRVVRSLYRERDHLKYDYLRVPYEIAEVAYLRDGKFFESKIKLSPESYPTEYLEQAKDQIHYSDLRKEIREYFDSRSPEPYYPTETELLRVKEAMQLSPIEIEHPIKFVAPIFSAVPAYAQHRIIHLTPAAFEFGPQKLASILLEEQVHIKTGFDDHTRELQTYLFEEWTRMYATQIQATKSTERRTQSSVWSAGEMREFTGLDSSVDDAGDSSSL